MCNGSPSDNYHRLEKSSCKLDFLELRANKRTIRLFSGDSDDASGGCLSEVINILNGNT